MPLPLFPKPPRHLFFGACLPPRNVWQSLIGASHGIAGSQGPHDGGILRPLFFVCVHRPKLTTDHLCRLEFQLLLHVRASIGPIGVAPTYGTRDASSVAQVQNHPNIDLHHGYKISHGHILATTIDSMPSTTGRVLIPTIDDARCEFSVFEEGC